jgi:hypothetical protein
VLRCLIDKRDEIKSDACKQEVFYFEKMEVGVGSVLPMRWVSWHGPKK